MITAQDVITAKQSPIYAIPYKIPDPLVSVCIATYNRSSILIERSLKSVLSQTYTKLDIVIVGDHCTDDTEARVRSLKEPRIRFVNLPHRTKYPDNPGHRWMVAGSVPMNHALDLAVGHFITHLDDDDEFTPRRIEKLVNCALVSRADFIHHPFWCECGTNQIYLNLSEAPVHGSVTTSALFYHHYLKQVHWDPHSYLLNEPGDWNKVRRMVELGIHTVRFGEPLTLKYR
jgi:glycosyltransferase involved in cell wall biosynthesis